MDGRESRYGHDGCHCSPANIHEPERGRRPELREGRFPVSRHRARPRADVAVRPEHRGRSPGRVRLRGFPARHPPGAPRSAHASERERRLPRGGAHSAGLLASEIAAEKPAPPTGGTVGALVRIVVATGHTMATTIRERVDAHPPPASSGATVLKNGAATHPATSRCAAALTKVQLTSSLCRNIVARHRSAPGRRGDVNRLDEEPDVSSIARRYESHRSS